MRTREKYKRINITLPKETLGLIDVLLEKGNRSRFIDTALRDFIEKKSRKKLLEELKGGGVARTSRDLDIVREWFHLEDEIRKQV